jgi:hypothetical protein
MGTIGYGYGSEWHMLRYLGYHRKLLNQKIMDETGGGAIDWLDFQFSTSNQPLGSDHEWQGVEFIDQPEVIRRWRKFWPQSGNPQNWDAVGWLSVDSRKELLLVEAKANAEEIHSDCGASNPQSIKMITRALNAARESFGVNDIPVKGWLSPYYQYCNRLAVLHFLMQVCDPPVPARLIFLYFYGDRNGNRDCPQFPGDWQAPLQTMSAAIGLNLQSVLLRRVHKIYLPVNPLIK